MTVERTDLPGVGGRVTLSLRSGERLEVVTYLDGRRELFGPEVLNGRLSVRMDADEACAIAALLCDLFAERGNG